MIPNEQVVTMSTHQKKREHTNRRSGGLTGGFHTSYVQRRRAAKKQAGDTMACYDYEPQDAYGTFSFSAFSDTKLGPPPSTQLSGPKYAIRAT